MKSRLKLNKFSKTHLDILSIALLLLLVPISLVIISKAQNYRSRASTPDNLETEAGTLSSTGVSKQTDSNASGGQYVLFNKSGGGTSSGGLYGTAYSMDTLANMQIGGDSSGASNTYVAIRFTAQQSSNLQSIKIYVVNQNHPGYGGGTGGTLKIDVVPEVNGVPSTNVLGSTTVVSPADVFQTYSFSSSIPLTKGTTYDIVFTNIDPNPTVNFVSVNFSYTFTATVPRQPGTTDAEFGALRKLGTGSWSVQTKFTPIIDIAYSNGTHQGQGYMEVEVGHPAYIGGSNTARERFTVTGGDKTVKTAYARVARTSGSGTMTMRLENSSGSLIDSCTIDSSNIPISTATSDVTAGSWYSCDFSSARTLTNGQTYNFRLTATNQLWSRGIQQGDGYGFNPATYFADGYLQTSTDNGSNWSTVTGLDNSGDLQFYFVQTNNAPTPTPSSGSWGPRSAPSTPTGSNVYTVPSSIDGTGSTDVTSALQSWINSQPNGTSSNPTILVFPAGKTYKMNAGLRVDNKNYVTFWGYNSTLRPMGSGSTTGNSGFRLQNSSNIKILGFRIKGANDLAGTAQAYGQNGEYSMGVALMNNSDDVEIADNHISNVFGDAIYVSYDSAGYPDRYNIHHNLLELTGRQGIVPDSGRDAYIEYNILRDTAMSSIDAEDARGGVVLGPLYIRSNLMDRWMWYGGYTCHALPMDYASGTLDSMHDIYIENNTFQGGCMAPAGTNGYPKSSDADISMWGTMPKTNIYIRNNTFNLPSNQQSSWAIRLNYVTGGEVSGNKIPGQTVQCSNCSNVTISNNN